MEETKISISVNIDKKMLYDYMLYHTYCNIRGAIFILVSLLAWGILAVRWADISDKTRMILFLAGAIYTIYMPIHLKLRANKQASMETFKNSLAFDFTEQGITVHQGEETAEAAWNQIYQIISRKTALYIYTGRIYAFIIPKEQAKNEWHEIIALADEHHVRIRA